MANVIPFFVTGANAKIKVNGKTLAFCTDVQYSVKIRHAAPHILGVYEAFTQEPLAYDVTGSFVIVRYISGMADYVNDGIGANTPADVSNTGNGVGAWGPSSGSGKFISSAIGNFSGNTRVDQSMDPSKLHVPQAFTIEIMQKARSTDSRFGVEVGILARLRDCRITGADFRLTKRGIASQVFSFQACYADEDSFSANNSGVGQTVI